MKGIKGLLFFWVAMVPLFFLPCIAYSLTGSVGQIVTSLNGDTLQLDSYLYTTINCNGTPDGWQNLHFGKTGHVSHVVHSNCTPNLRQTYESWDAHLAGPLCVDEAEQAAIDCGDAEFVIWDDFNDCIYHCQQCDEVYQEAVYNCGEGNFIFDNVECDYICKDCTDQYAEAEIECKAFGIEWFDFDICTYKCADDCDGAFDNCYHKCYTKNGIYKFSCTDTDIEGEESHYTCECNDDNSDTDPPPDDDPPPESPPDDDPSPDPDPDSPPDENPDPGDPDDDSGWLKAIKHNTDDLVKLADERNNDWLYAIKENQDIQIKQLNDQSAYLNHISDGTDVMIRNQGVLNNTLKANGGKIDQTNKLLGDLKNKKFELEDQTMSGEGPELPDDHIYDVTVVNPEEESFVDTINDYITDGLPLMTFINGSYLDVGSQTSVLSFEIYGKVIETDLASFSDVLDVMGVLLLGVATLCSFLIIVGRI